jgi:hypothetical protein
LTGSSYESNPIFQAQVHGGRIINGGRHSAGLREFLRAISLEGSRHP